MANSYIEYTGNGSRTAHITPNYMAGRGATDIVVTIDGQTYTDWTFDTLNGTAITLAAAPATGTTVRITRTTSQNARINTYSENTILTSAQLNTDGDQSFMMSQEAIDVAGETNLAAGTFYFSQANAPTTTRAGTLWYDLTATPNILKVYSGGDPYDATKWEAAVPIHDTKVYKNAANVAQGILAVSDASGLGLGANYTDKSYIIDTAFNSSGFVFLNGVKLIAGDAITDIAGGFGDYFHDASTNRVYFTDISNSDELVTETFSGSFSQEVTDKEASAQAAKQAALNAQSAAETAQGLSETAKGLSQEYATKAENNTVTGTSDYSAFHWMKKAEDEKDAAVVAKNTAVTAKEDAVKYAITDANSTFTDSAGTSGLKSALRYASEAASSASDASGSAVTASGHKDTATTKATLATDKAADAQGYADTAHGSTFTTSASSGSVAGKRSALAYMTDSQRYADTAHGVTFTDTYGTTGKKSALHYAHAANLSAQSLSQFGAPFTVVSGYLGSNTDLGELDSAISSLHGEESLTAQSDLAKDVGSYDLTSL